MYEQYDVQSVTRSGVNCYDKLSSSSVFLPLSTTSTRPRALEVGPSSVHLQFAAIFIDLIYTSIDTLPPTQGMQLFWFPVSARCRSI